MTRRVVAAAFLLLAALLLAGPASAKSYHFPRVEIEATILPDGTLELRERRTYEFDGSFSSATFTVEPARSPFARIEGLAVHEEGRPLPFELTQQPGGGIEASWSYTAADERRTFEISYRVRCAVDVYDDAAHLLWQFVGTGWTERTESVRVTVRVPGRAAPPPPAAQHPCPGEPPVRSVPSEPLRPGDVRAWGHGPLGGQVEIRDPQTVILRIRDLEPATFVEGSILMPRDVVPLAYPYPGGPGREEILAEEGALARAANEARRGYVRERSFGRRLLVGIPLAVAVLIMLSRLRDRVPGLPRILEEPPEDIHPVELSYLWDAYRGRYLPRNAFRTQLLHLARQGAISLEAVGRVTEPEDLLVRLRRKPKSGIDADFTEFLFPDTAREVSMAGLKAAGVRQKPLRAWTDAAKDKASAGVDRIRRAGPRLEALILFLVAAGGVVWWLTSDYARGVGLLVALAAVLGWVVGLRFVRPRLPPDLRERMERWASFRRFLARFSTLPDAPALAVVIWERYLVYATALGVADQVERQVGELVAPEDLPSPWRGAPSGADGLVLTRGFYAVTPAGAPAVVTPGGGGGFSFSSGVGSFSSGGGFGGGFSGGGGGGGGGTGGGAG